MTAALGDTAAADEWRAIAARLRTAVNAHVRRPRGGGYGYLVHGAGERAGRLEPYQEANGPAFAVLFGAASPEQVRAVLGTTHREPRGVVNGWPHFDRHGVGRPGRATFRHRVARYP